MHINTEQGRVELASGRLSTIHAVGWRGTDTVVPMNSRAARCYFFALQILALRVMYPVWWANVFNRLTKVEPSPCEAAMFMLTEKPAWFSLSRSLIH